MRVLVFHGLFDFFLHVFQSQREDDILQGLVTLFLQQFVTVFQFVYYYWEKDFGAVRECFPESVVELLHDLEATLDDVDVLVLQYPLHELAEMVDARRGVPVVFLQHHQDIVQGLLTFCPLH